MRLEKIKNILLLIKMMRSSASGVSLEDITKTFNVSYRTAQRMIAAVSDPDLALGVETVDFWDTVKRWRISRKEQKDDFFTRDDLFCLKEIENLLSTQNADRLKRLLIGLEAKIKNRLPEKTLKKTEADMNDKNETEIYLQHPVNRFTAENEKVISLIKQAAASFHKMSFSYTTSVGKVAERCVSPYGIIHHFGKSYLIAEENEEILTFNILNIRDTKSTKQTFQKHADFSLKEYACQNAVGIFHGDEENIVLLFAKEAASFIENYSFHPTQKMKKNKDGSMTLSMRTGGLRELCYFLVAWEDSVQIIAPERLKQTMRDVLNKATKQLENF